MSLTYAKTFWSTTVADHWEKEPFVLRRSEGAPQVGVERLWPLAVEASEARRAGSRRIPSVSFWLERAEAVDNADSLPRREHADLAAYLEALGERVGPKDFTLLINAAQTLSRDVFRDVLEFVEPLVAQAGLAVTETAIYLSRSRRTVFGVHCDESSNFLFVAYGTKRFRLWKREVIDAHPHLRNATEYAEIMDQSTYVELAAGDLLYMPSGCYHIAESDGDVGFHLSVVVNVDPAMARKIVEYSATRVVGERLRSVPATPFLPMDDGARVRLPSALAEGLRTLAEKGVQAEVERAVVEQWAKFASAAGFTNVPPVATEGPLSDDATLSAVAGRPILYRLGEEDVLVASHGNALRFPARPALVRLLERLNDGATWRVDALLAEHAPADDDAAAARAMLRSLVAMGALSVSG